MQCLICITNLLLCKQVTLRSRLTFLRPWPICVIDGSVVLIYDAQHLHIDGCPGVETTC